LLEDLTKFNLNNHKIVFLTLNKPTETIRSTERKDRCHVHLTSFVDLYAFSTYSSMQQPPNT
jgi:hypothetical protein